MRDGVSHRFPEEAFAHLVDLEDKHFWFRSRVRLITWALEHHFPNAQSLLDVGCGTAGVLESIRRARPTMRLVGADTSEQALRMAASRVDAEFVRADAVDLPFDDEFDVVGTFDVLEHVDDDAAALRQLASVLRPGGGLIATVPLYGWLWSRADDYGGHRRRYTTRAIESRVLSAGFSILRSTAWMTLLLPVVALSRIVERKKKHDAYDPTRELVISPTLNQALEAILAVENSAIRRGVSMPVGVSRLIVARRT